MFSEDYFTSRNRLTSVVKKIRTFANEGGFVAPSLDKNEDLVKELERPLRLLVLGEPKAGKSSLLAALFGPRLMMPENVGGVYGLDLYKLGQKKANKDLDNGVRELARPLIDLKYIELTDTRGKPFDPQKRDQENWKYIDTSDFIVAVFSSQNPWCASTWDVLAAMGKEALERTMIVIQQIDLLDKRDLRVVTEHMWSLVEQKLPELVPIFLVSAERGMASRSGKTMAKHVWMVSGCGTLEKELERRAMDLNRKTGFLGELRLMADSLLEEVEVIMGDRQREIARKEVMLARLEEETDEYGSEEIAEFSKQFNLLGHIFQGLGKEALSTLNNRLGFVSSVTSLFKREALPAEIERSLVNSFGDAIGDRAKGDIGELIDKCKAHWELGSDHFRKEFDMEPQKFDFLEEVFAVAGKNFAEALRQKTHHTVVDLRLRSKLDLFIGERQSRLRVYVASMMILTAIAGFIGGAGWGGWVLPVSVLSVAGFVGIIAILYIRKSAREIVELFSEQLVDSQKDLVFSLQDVYRAKMRDVFLEYGAFFDEPRNKISESRKKIAPLQAKWNSLYLELKAIEQELHGQLS